MPHHDTQIGEVIADLVEMHHVLAFRRNARPGDACIDHDRNVEIDACLVDRVVAAVAHGYLGIAASRKGGHGHDPVLGVGSADATDGRGDLVRVDFQAGYEAVGVTS